MNELEATVLIDNIGTEKLAGEWGLSFYIEYRGRKYLLDTGASGNFLDNAELLGIDIKDVDCAILSHAHNDHSLGMEQFFRANEKARFHISADAAEDCYAGIPYFCKYIGLPKGILRKYPDRIVRCSGLTRIDDGVWTVAHSTPGLASIGRKAHLLRKRGFRYVYDDFAHEQSLVFETGNGLVVFNSCSHSGPGAIVKEAVEALHRQVYAYIGGLHLFRLDDTEVGAIADQLSASDIKEIYTGHCTGDRAFSILKERFGDNISQFRSGMKISF